MDRSSHLLIAYVDLDNDDQMYFLQIRPHISSVWTEQELVRILVDNWPEMKESRKVTGAYSLSADITDDDYKKLRKINANTLVDLHDGRIYMGANLGLNSAGTSVRSVIQHDAYINNARAVEEAMGESVDIIVKTINRKLSEPENHFKLKMITPKNNDYLFEVVDHGFLLRYKIREDGKGKIIVGDTAEQIEEAMQKVMK